MSENSVGRNIHEKEQALLRRCRAFVFGHPESPGGGSKDILYHTPGGRWLRICAGNVFFNDLEMHGIELTFRINSFTAGLLFDRYGWARPPELDRSSRWVLLYLSGAIDWCY
jgi:hypothetical protein